MNLTEFLLARIAEDELRAWALQERAQYVRRELENPKYLGRLIPGWSDWPEVEATAVRVLAECEARRRIVEFYGGPVGQMYVLPFLALPYADHADYDGRWRP